MIVRVMGEGQYEVDDALQTRLNTIAKIDTGTTRDDLIELALQLLRLYLGDSGHAALRMALDIDKSLSPQQRSRALHKLRGYAEDFRKLSR